MGASFEGRDEAREPKLADMAAGRTGFCCILGVCGKIRAPSRRVGTQEPAPRKKINPRSWYAVFPRHS